MLPLTHTVPGFPGIAKYPVDAWEKMGAPAFTLKSWAKLCMRNASGELTNLENIATLCKMSI